MKYLILLNFLLPLILAPLALGVVNQTKAFFAGRKGTPFLQLYWDLFKLLQKDFIYSRTTSLLFRIAPLVVVCATLMLLVMMPMVGSPALIFFEGDVLLFIYFLVLVRFFLVTAAMDTGSSFEGMGAAREVFFSALAEPVMMMAFVTLVYMTKSFSLTGIVTSLTPATWHEFSPQLILLTVTLFIVLLLESSRIPFDDPNTHLELTMIHEVMVLDYSGFDLGLLLYASSLKFWILASLIVNIAISSFIPHSQVMGTEIFKGLLLNVVGVLLIALVVGVVESSMARLKLSRVPRLIIGAFLIAALSILLL